eukprot:1147496-Pyramimonas_sp.AAC.1
MCCRSGPSLIKAPLVALRTHCRSCVAQGAIELQAPSAPTDSTSSQPDIPFNSGRAFRTGPGGEIPQRDGPRDEAAQQAAVAEDSFPPCGGQHGLDCGDPLGP